MIHPDDHGTPRPEHALRERALPKPDSPKSTGIGGAPLYAGSGLEGLRDRIAAVDGTLHVQSAPGAGTVLRARLPVP